MLLPARPPMVADELASLVGFLNQQRVVLLWKLESLDEEQARRPMVPSGISLLGLIKHLVWVERRWFLDFIGGQAFDYPWNEEDPDADFRIEDDETVESMSRMYRAVVDKANAVIEDANSLDTTRMVGGEKRSLRWAILHMIEETARHAGHADIIREQIDGVTGYLPPHL